MNIQIKNKKILIIIFFIVLLVIGILIYFLSKNKQIQCKKECKNGGKCDTKKGLCSCLKGFGGDDCSKCKNNYDTCKASRTVASLELAPEAVQEMDR